MEAFQLLTRGGHFNKSRFQKDVQLFQKTEPRRSAPSVDVSESAELPTELDFFKYAEGGAGPSSKRKASASNEAAKKKRRTEEQAGTDDEDTDEEEDVPEDPQQPLQPKHRVTTKGKNAPVPIETFDDLRERWQPPAHLLVNLAKNQFSQPTAIQSHCTSIIMEGRDLAAISPTGTGKTLAYLVPIITSLQNPASGNEDAGKGARAVIVAPTRELAQQIYNECLKLTEGRKWRIVLFSKATANTLSDKLARDKVDIIIATPLRLVACLQSGNLELTNVRHLVLDEADRLLDTEFHDQLEEIIAACSHSKVQKAVFSATLPAGAEQMALGMMRDPIRIVVGLKDTPLPLISQSLTYVADEQSKLPSLLTYLARPYNPPVLIFTSSQPRAASLAEELVLNSISHVDCLHAGLSMKGREDAISRMRRGESWVMVTTDVMARGMDFKGVREVINYDFPTSVQNYIHRIGRTGRAGREGKAVTYFTNEDAPSLKPIANVLLQSGSSVPEWIVKLPKPSKMKRKQMGKVKRGDTVNNARKVGRNDAVKKRDMIVGSKRRAAKATAPKGDTVATGTGDEEK